MKKEYSIPFVQAPRQTLVMSGAPGHTSQLEHDNSFLNQKRGGDPQKQKLHNYLVSKSYRPHPALDKLQEVWKLLET